jgi:hypothetical protein
VDQVEREEVLMTVQVLMTGQVEEEEEEEPFYFMLLDISKQMVLLTQLVAMEVMELAMMGVMEEQDQEVELFYNHKMLIQVLVPSIRLEE